MQMNNYLSVCMFQLDINLDCNSKEEYLIETNETLRQIEKALCIIEKLKPDISLFPEMVYLSRYEKAYQEQSISRIIVAGSYYKQGINTTVIFMVLFHNMKKNG